LVKTRYIGAEFAFLDIRWYNTYRKKRRKFMSKLFVERPGQIESLFGPLFIKGRGEVATAGFLMQVSWVGSNGPQYPIELSVGDVVGIRAGGYRRLRVEEISVKEGTITFSRL
jgi:hypothetical protein